jgi:hypothetical protein
VFCCPFMFSPGLTAPTSRHRREIKQPECRAFSRSELREKVRLGTSCSSLTSHEWTHGSALLLRRLHLGLRLRHGLLFRRLLCSRAALLHLGEGFRHPERMNPAHRGEPASAADGEVRIIL